jgi:hypothetical protein
MNPPPLPEANAVSVRRASAANIILPGAGLFLVGRRRLGAVLAGIFLASFVAVFGLFIFGYASYLNAALDPELLQEGRLERAAEGFHLAWLLGAAAIGMVSYVVATILFLRVRRRLKHDSGA